MKDADKIKFIPERLMASPLLAMQDVELRFVNFRAVLLSEQKPPPRSALALDMGPQANATQSHALRRSVARLSSTTPNAMKAPKELALHENPQHRSISIWWQCARIPPPNSELQSTKKQSEILASTD
jgi:hypothetical protein